MSTEFNYIEWISLLIFDLYSFFTLKQAAYPDQLIEVNKNFFSRRHLRRRQKNSHKWMPINYVQKSLNNFQQLIWSSDCLICFFFFFGPHLVLIKKEFSVSVRFVFIIFFRVTLKWPNKHQPISIKKCSTNNCNNQIL